MGAVEARFGGAALFCRHLCECKARDIVEAIFTSDANGGTWEGLDWMADSIPGSDADGWVDPAVYGKGGWSDAHDLKTELSEGWYRGGDGRALPAGAFG
jgi:hypothetical protein